jgi:tetratricopeptide (TPR) repeat protein
MAFDKTKVVRAAEKYLAQGKIPAAIKEYRAIVEHDQSDFTALNMLGDLYVRSGNKADAIKAFTRIAEHYRGQGFALKAIAMYKKIDRLQPGSIEIANQLAALYEMQGLIVDARAQYLAVADALSRDGESQKALNVLRKVADLDSHNVEIRLRLADGYMHENLRVEAGRAYAEAGGQLLARGQHERALDALKKALSIDPRDKESLSHLVSAHLAVGSADEAAEMLETALAERPGDVELLTLLVSAYIEAENAPAAERTAVALFSQDSANYQRFVDVARLYLRQDNADAAVRVLSGITEQVLNAREEEELIRLLNETLARNPEQLDALRLLVRVYTWQPDDVNLRNVLEQLAEAAEAAGQSEEERQALAQLIQLAPEEARYRERLQALGGAPESFETPYASDTSFASLPMSGEVPTFESFMVSEEGASGTTSSGSDATAEQFGEFEWNTVGSPTDAMSTSAPPAADASTPGSAAGENWGDASTASAELSNNAQASTDSSFQEFDFSSAVAETPNAANSANQPVEANQTALTPDARREAMLRQELESVDFYLAQGYAEIARDTLEMLERQFGAHAEIDARRAQIPPTPPIAVPAASTPIEGGGEFGFALYNTVEETAPTAAEEALSEIDEVDTAFEILGSQTSTPSQPTAPVNAPAPTPAAPVPPAVAASQNSIDPGLASIFDEFRSAIEEDEPATSNGDYETHYNLGLAYKEMDLVDEAVEEFQTAAGLSAPQDGTPRYLQCCNLIGHCFMQKGMPRLAVMWFKKGLDAPGHTEDEYQALRFELGGAFEQMGDLDQAIDTFTEVYGVNVSYRGVADKLRNLQAQKAVTGNK